MSLKGLINFFNLDGMDEEDEFENYVDDYEEEAPQRTTAARSSRNTAKESSEEKRKMGAIRRPKPKVVSLNRTITDSQEICNTLLESKPVVVNLEGFDADDAQRIMDFISGCIYAINGKYHQISKYVFIFTPEQVDISGDTLDQVKEQSDTMPTINREF